MAGGRRHATEFPVCAVEAYSEGLNFWKGSRGENKTFGPSRAESDDGKGPSPASPRADSDGAGTRHWCRWDVRRWDKGGGNRS
ncbi:hypothetical protein ERO13_D10G223701v2 [Gossypium hirsutum]|uniref:Uncharacterized protein n=2 Tax=Gossypium TaxID=3633 RepID=A0A5J5SFM3_GOSBA|nr:hypothetical protein ES319_D02G048000v1 [Gossypium barbadense]KAG4127580.1 hypothetical protein ERO13_D10G223701v2 [Gossypium hirsutum]TYG36165.1 hypothetical protein ES288_D13G042800v1 [Gossypium darwinii]TYG78361.1 hypothetical protein ES288_D02G052700v1 [Gossypium darwinii]